MDKSLVIISAAIIGFVGGILLAPKSGKETRQDLMNKKEEIQDKAQKSLDTIKKGASSIKDEITSDAKDVKEIAKAPSK